MAQKMSTNSEYSSLSSQFRTKFDNFATNAIHAGFESGDHSGFPVVLPISTSTTFKQPDPDKLQAYSYSRTNNPTRESVEKNIAALENAKHCCLFSSGIAALNAIVCSELRAGDHIVCQSDAYGGTNRYLRIVSAPLGVDYSLVDLRDLQRLGAALTNRTRLIVIESPTNPLMRVVDIAATSAFLRKACPEALLVVDNTFASPYFQRPLELGAQLVWHSCTKYLNGHSDVVNGALCTSDDQLAERLHFNQKVVGAVPSPFDCFLLWRGLKTLHLRMERHMQNASRVASALLQHPLVRRVHFPGLESHPEHELSKRQMCGVSGMLSFLFAESVPTSLIELFFKELKIFTLAESLGAVESLIEIPAQMTHMSVPASERAELGIDERLVRVSVGLEDAEDLVEDLTHALDRVARAMNSDALLCGESSKGAPSRYRFATEAIHAGFKPEDFRGCPVVLPISPATTFKQPSPEHLQQFIYSRITNPTRECVEKNLAALEGAKFCELFASGHAALHGLACSTLQAGDHVVCQSDIYSTTVRYLKTVASRFGITYSLIDMSDCKHLQSSITNKTKLVLLETPTNPLLRLVDIRDICSVVHEQNSSITIAIDNTAATPYFQRPLKLGVDVVLYSCTKYLNGHSDVVMGALCTNNTTLAEKFMLNQKGVQCKMYGYEYSGFAIAVGGVPSPFDCYLLWRGLKTLHVRMERHMQNASAVASALLRHPLVSCVNYPGLQTHPQRELAARQMTGFSGLMSFTFDSRVTREAIRLFLSELKIFALAESFGATESLVEMPYDVIKAIAFNNNDSLAQTTTYTTMTGEEMLAVGVDDRLCRLSVGLEDAETITSDLIHALDRVAEHLKIAL